MSDLAAELSQAGIDICRVDLNRIGEWQHVPTEDKPHRRNGHVKVFDTRPLAVWYQNMATDASGYYREQGSPFHTFRSLLRAAPPPVQCQKGWGTAAKAAKCNWDQAVCADPEHPYLALKQVQPHGIRQLGVAEPAGSFVDGDPLALARGLHVDGLMQQDHVERPAFGHTVRLTTHPVPPRAAASIRR